MIKKLLLGLGVVVVLLVAAVVIVPMLIPAETYVSEITKQVEEQTGRSFRIGGEPSISLFPTLSLEVEDVALGNVAGGKAKDMVSLKKLTVALDLMPALSGNIVVNRFVMVDPVIHLEVDKNGRPNWELNGATKSSSSGGSSSSGSGGSSSGGTSSGAAGSGFIKDIQLGDVRLVNGLVTYDDASGGVSERIDNITAKIELPGLSRPFGFDGALDWHGETIDLDLRTGALQGLLDGRQTQTKATVASKHLNFSYDGKVTLAELMRVVGDIALDTPSIRELAAWAGAPLPADVGGDGLGPLSIKGKLSATPKNVAFTDAKIAVDKIDATGSLNVALSGRKPTINAALDIKELDLNHYLPPEARGGTMANAGGTSSGSGGGAAKKGPPPDWSDEPIDVSGLHQANANLELSLGALKVQKIKIGRSVMDIRIKDGRMRADLKELNMYDGKASGVITVDATGSAPRIEEQFTMSGLQALPFLKDAADFDRLEGTVHATASLKTVGRTQRQMVRNANGAGNVKFLDGAIIGVNLAAMVRNVATAFLDSKAGQQQKTDFAELSGTYKITRGILTNNDLKMIAPLIRLAGAGKSNLPKRTVNYRIEPKAVASLQGQGGDSGAKGITVPVIVKGPWHDLSYEPDLAGLLTGGGVDAVKDLIGDPGSALKGVLGGGSGQSGSGGVLNQLLGGGAQQSGGTGQQQPKPSLEDAGKQLLKGLFGD